MQKEKTIGQKMDGYDDIFNDHKPVSTPFYMTGIAEILLSSFYETDGLARRIVDVVPEEMISAGFKVDGIADDKRFRSEWDELKLGKKITDALCWSRLHGGSAIVAVINDNRMLKSPAKPGSKLEDIRVYDRFQVSVETRETNARSVRYGEPVLYKVTPGDNMEPYIVHYTRIHCDFGLRMTSGQRKINDGWGSSVLTPRLIEAICDYNYCHELATQLLRRKQQAVWKAKDLAELCDDNEGMYAARMRLAQVSDNSGVGKPIGIDGENEDYSVLNSDISGVDAFLQEKMDRIVSLSGIHEIVLKNKNVGGVSASQNTALETFYKLIDRERHDHYKPILEFLLSFMLTEEEWSVSFDPLSVPSDMDEAEIMNKNADTLTKLETMQALSVEEVRNTIRSIMPKIKLTESALPTGTMTEEQDDSLEPESVDNSEVDDQ